MQSILTTNSAIKVLRIVNSVSRTRHDVSIHVFKCIADSLPDSNQVLPVSLPANFPSMRIELIYSFIENHPNGYEKQSTYKYVKVKCGHIVSNNALAATVTVDLMHIRRPNSRSGFLCVRQSL